MSKIRYSKQIKGARGNYNWPVTFDMSNVSNGGYLGISQPQDGGLDRVLLSPGQVKELAKFIVKRAVSSPEKPKG